jgi:hypothetical protein
VMLAWRELWLCDHLCDTFRGLITGKIGVGGMTLAGRESPSP